MATVDKEQKDDTVDNHNEDYCVVVVARHGERQDYITRDAGGNWVAEASRKWDTPLTAHGWSHQALLLGKHLVSELERLDLPPISGIYSSPHLRCRQTAAQARQGILEATPSLSSSLAALTETPTLLPVRIEMGLVESINTSWYRSWALPDADGTWGGPRPRSKALEDATTLHPRSLEPVQGILSEWSEHWNEQNPETPVLDRKVFDLEYKSQTTIDQPYTYYPRYVETDEEQRKRMTLAVSLLAGQSAPNQTLLFVSHGAPVTHLFEELTGRHRSEHGSSSYCCYSLYKVLRRDLMQFLLDDTTQRVCWQAVQVNQADFLHEDIVHEQHI